jgi:hypothetical protein
VPEESGKAVSGSQRSFQLWWSRTRYLATNVGFATTIGRAPLVPARLLSAAGLHFVVKCRIMRSLVVMAVCLLLPCAASAQYDNDLDGPSEAPVGKLHGLTLGFGAGYGLPFGDVAQSGSSSTALGDSISGIIPLMVDLGFRSDALFAVALALSYAPALTKNCDSGYSCEAHDTQVGLDVRLHFETRERFSGWFAAGIGYEWLTAAMHGPWGGGEVTFKGYLLGLQLGGDYRVGPTLTVGPFVGLRFGKFTNDDSHDISSDNQSWHGWVTLGVRSEFTL